MRSAAIPPGTQASMERARSSSRRHWLDAVECRLAGRCAPHLGTLRQLTGRVLLRKHAHGVCSTGEADN